VSFLVSGQQALRDIAVDATHVYWVNRDGGGVVMRARKP